MLNIQLLVVRLMSHSSSPSKCVERNTYNKKIQFPQIIIHDIGMTGTFVIEFLHKSRRCWHLRE
jgi:glutaredoxin